MVLLYIRAVVRGGAYAKSHEIHVLLPSRRAFYTMNNGLLIVLWLCNVYNMMDALEVHDIQD